MEYLPLIGTVVMLNFFGMISPGPDFLLTVKNALQYSRKIGIMTAIGLSLGISVHMFYCSIGIAFIISQSILAFTILKFLGAGYLIYIGFQSFFSRTSDIEITEEKSAKKQISSFKVIQIGFLGNVFNPKITLFFLSLFTFVISPDTPSYILALLSVIIMTMILLWFSLVAIFFTQPRVQKVFNRFQEFFNKLFGSLLIALGVKIALSEK